ncbi:uncharacterized protein LOC127873577 [Dreissena polymorpha]|uniref:BTB domain-containing protein n=1 Tax=Dreissena polymorpha TaxID=45954 RepID=A0A9D4QW33_DREPO|nr:uncharacterized protein LOC127873577 [Dreissena polymorpha]KAH3844305.1 hypothetical protein DPMN_086563 [Dreissena polymorpha]
MSRSAKLTDHLYRQVLEKSELCDVTVTFGDHVMGAHWGVLVQCSYFRAMYNSGMKERREGIIHIVTKGDNGCVTLEECAIDAAIRYLYTGIITLSFVEVYDILRVADYFRIAGLKQVCNRFLSNLKWEPQNCIDICYMAKQYHLDLTRKLMKYITRDILNVLEHDCNINYITNEIILEVAKIAKEIQMSTELQFNAFHKWLCFDDKARTETFVKLFRSLSLEHTTHEFFDSLDCDLVQSLSDCRDHYMKTKQKSLRERLRNSSKSCDVVLMVAEVDDDYVSDETNTCCIFAYMTDYKRWSILAAFPEELDHEDVKMFLTFDKTCNILYVYRDVEPIYPQAGIIHIGIHKYDLTTKTWHACTLNMKTPNGIVIQNIGCTNGKLCFVATCIKSQTVKLLVFGKKDKEVVLFNLQRSIYADVYTKMCSFENQYVVVLCYIVREESEKEVKIAVYNLHSNKIKRIRNIPQAIQNPDDFYEMEEFLIETKEGIIISKVNCSYYKSLNIKTGRCSTINKVVLPRELITSNNHEHDADIDFPFGIVSCTGLNTVAIHERALDRLCIFDVLTQTLNEEQSLPFGIPYGQMLHTKLPSDCLTCFYECTHCKFKIETAEEKQDDCKII